MGIVANSNAMFDGEFPIERSLRCMSASSQYLTRTPPAGNRTTWSLSFWIKRGAMTTRQDMFGIDNSNGVRFESSDAFTFEVYNGAGADYYLTTSALYRDPSSHMHVLVVWDSNNGAASDRQRIYINGSRITSFASSGNTIPLGALSNWNNSVANNILRNPTGGFYLDGYVSNIHFIDGQALNQFDFGKTNSVTGQWVAKKYTGTYGTNGFYLDFKDGTSTTTLGQDKSGNNNHWTLSNFVRANGINDCWSKDTPTGNGNNFPTMNPLDKGGSLTLSNGNLSASIGAAWNIARSTFAIYKGRWYWEGTFNATAAIFGLTGLVSNLNTNLGVSAQDYGYQSNGTKWNNNVNPAYGTTIAVNEIVGVVFDADNRTIEFYKLGVSQGIAYTNIPAGTFYPAFSVYGGSVYANFGQREFAYPIPMGCKPLCTKNLPTPIIEKGSRHFTILPYTGDGNLTRSFSGFEFSPDLIWIKSRAGISHCLWNSIVGGGTNTALASDRTVGESGHNADATNGFVTTFDSSGFSVQRGSTGAYTNNASTSYVAWLWNASDSERVYNNKGSIPSFVKSNIRAGFSIVTYTGTGANATVGHGLGIAPKFILGKARQDDVSWLVYNINIGASNVLFLNGTNAQTSSPTTWNSTAPTSSVFSLGTDTSINQSTKTYVAYCFADVEGYSKYGSYIGNGSADGPFVWTGFRPRYIMFKRTDAASAWVIYDSSRDTYNVTSIYLQAQSAAAEASAATVDFTSNGFKLRTSGDPNVNAGTYIYMAIAENPFQYSNAR